MEHVHLPLELWFTIFTPLSFSEIYQIMRVCRTFLSIIDTDQSWKSRYLQSFDPLDTPVHSWKEACQNYGTMWVAGHLDVYGNDVPLTSICDQPNILSIKTDNLFLHNFYLTSIDLTGKLHCFGLADQNVFGLDTYSDPGPWAAFPESRRNFKDQLITNTCITGPVKTMTGSTNNSLILMENGTVLLNNIDRWRFPLFSGAKQVYSLLGTGFLEAGFIILDMEDRLHIVYPRQNNVDNCIQLDMSHKKDIRAKQCIVPKSGTHFYYIDLDDNLWYYSWTYQGGMVPTKNIQVKGHKVKQAACTAATVVFIDLDNQLWAQGTDPWRDPNLGANRVPDLLAKQVICQSTYTLVLDIHGQVWATGDNIPGRTEPLVGFGRILEDKVVLKLFASDNAMGALLHPSPAK